MTLRESLNDIADQLVEAIELDRSKALDRDEVRDLITDRVDDLEVLDSNDVGALIDDKFDQADWQCVVEGVDISQMIDWEYQLEEYARADGPGSDSERIAKLEGQVKWLGGDNPVSPTGNLTSRVTELEGILQAVSDSLMVMAMGLRGGDPVDPQMVREVMAEAEEITPDNRTDGNGIRIADLEAVDDELTGRACEEGVEFS